MAESWETETEGPPTDHVHDVSCWARDCQLFDVHGEWAEPDAPSRAADPA